MATKKTKTLKDVTTVTTVNADQYIPLADASGKVTKITLANLKASISGGMSLDAITDGVRIAYKINSALYAVNVSTWISFVDNSNRHPVGVLLVGGGKTLLVATNSVAIPWGSSIEVSGGVSVKTPEDATNDFNGKANTKKLIEHPEFNTKDYAPGFCNLYTVEGAEDSGGKWWLPSAGEMMMIAANIDKINYALSVIDGANQIYTAKNYFTSSEYDASKAWMINIDNMGLRSVKKTVLEWVIPVASFNI